MKQSIPSDASPLQESESWIQRTLLFKHWDAMKQEILLHKWYESERAGHDIGWERAQTDWIIRFGSRFPTPPRP
ncbi:MAG TPA: DUF4032 domain-containing protein [Kiritimatiellia bacterium]|nr:DUF4032 domain-containing protein [Kiritimatiellia bacterium]